MIKPGQTIEVVRAYSTRGFSMRADEPLGGDYAAFDRTGREPRLVQLSAGEPLVAITASNADGYVYARRADKGYSLACVLLPESYKAK